MRNKVLLLGSAIIILLLLLVVVFKPDSSNKSTTSSESVSTNPFESIAESKKIIDTKSALGTVTTCFNWYIQGIIKNGDAWYAAEQEQIDDCFTEAYISQFGTIISQTGSDPILSVQGIYDSWGSPVRARILSEDTATAKAEVTIGLEQESALYRVDTTWSEKNGWRISSVTKVETVQ